MCLAQQQTLLKKACELAPIGPVVFIDTAGTDDVGALGAARVERSLAVLEWVDIALVVSSAQGISTEDKEIIERAKALGTPAILVLNKAGVFLHLAKLSSLKLALLDSPSLSRTR